MLPQGSFFVFKEGTYVKTKNLRNRILHMR
jgi:hypothetical protein